MSAGQPNWQALADQGKLPANQKDKVPHMAQVQALEQLNVELEKKFDLAYSLLTPDQRKEFHMTLKGLKPAARNDEE
ncbi:MAG: hypothetical protein KGJ93_05285 [Patescibacteria group bacterium]|nr:hypothetical protein [Patescibacteria group bacterium]